MQDITDLRELNHGHIGQVVSIIIDVQRTSKKDSKKHYNGKLLGYAFIKNEYQISCESNSDPKDYYKYILAFEGFGTVEGIVGLTEHPRNYSRYSG